MPSPTRHTTPSLAGSGSYGPWVLIPSRVWTSRDLGPLFLPGPQFPHLYDTGGLELPSASIPKLMGRGAEGDGGPTRDFPARGPAHPWSEGSKRPPRTGGGGRIIRNPTRQPLAAAKAEREAPRPASPGDGTGEWGPQPGLRREPPWRRGRCRDSLCDSERIGGGWTREWEIANGAPSLRPVRRGARRGSPEAPSTTAAAPS